MRIITGTVLVMTMATLMPTLSASAKTPQEDESFLQRKLQRIPEEVRHGVRDGGILGTIFGAWYAIAVDNPPFKRFALSRPLVIGACAGSVLFTLANVLESNRSK